MSYTYTSWRKEKKRKGKRRSSKARKAKTRVKVVLLTTLLDPKAYPKQEIKALYRSRWEAELAFRELKSHMLGSHVAFRSKTPTRVLQEAFAQLIAYQCLRGLMASAAVKAGKKPLQISFTGALEILTVALPIGPQTKRDPRLDRSRVPPTQTKTPALPARRAQKILSIHPQAPCSLSLMT